MKKVECETYYKCSELDFLVPYEIAIWLTKGIKGNVKNPRMACKRELRKYNPEVLKEVFDDYFDNVWYEIAEEGTNFIRPLLDMGCDKWEILGIKVDGIHQLIPTFNHVCGGYYFNGEQKCVMMRFYSVSEID